MEEQSSFMGHGSLKSFILETPREISIGNVRSCRVAPNFLFIGLLDTDSSLNIYILGRHSLFPACLQVQSFYWEENLESMMSSRFIVHHLDGSLAVYCLSSSPSPSLETNCLFTYKDLQLLLTEQDIEYKGDCQLHYLRFKRNVVSLILNESKCVFFNVESQTIVQVINLLSFVKTYIDIELQLEQLLLLTMEYIYVVSIIKNCLMKKISFEDILINLKIPSCSFTPFMFTANEKTSALIIASEEGTVLVMDKFLEENEDAALGKNHFLINHKMTVPNALACENFQPYIASNKVDPFVHSVEKRSPLNLQFSSGSLWKQRLNLLEQKINLGSFQRNKKKPFGGSSTLMKMRFHKENLHVFHPPMGCITICGLHNKVRYGYLYYSVGISKASEKMLVIKLIDLHKRRELAIFEVKEPYLIVEGSGSNHPDLILTEHNFLILIKNISEEVFINKLIYYGNANIADTLSTTNKWQSLKLPVYILSLGLKNHQLDTVTFFMKNRFNAFKSQVQTVEAFSNDSDLQTNELRCMTEMIVSLVHEHRHKNQSIAFVKQLVKITMKHLKEILQHVLTVGQSSLIQSKECILLIEVIMRYLVRLRSHLRTIIIPCIDLKMLSTACAASLRSDVDHLYRNWKQMTCKAVIEYALSKHMLPVSQVFFLQNGTILPKNVTTWNFISSEAKNSLTEFICRNNLLQAYNIVNNLGLNAIATFYDLCMNTTDSVLQEHLINYLSARGILNERELQVVQNMQTIKKSFPCTSFTKSLEMRSDDSSIKSWKYSWNYLKACSKPPVLSAVSCPSLNPGDLNHKNMQDNWEKVHYSSLNLNWIKRINQFQVELIAVDGVSPLKGDTCKHYDKPSVLWKYFLSLNDEKHLFQLIKDKKFIDSQLVLDSNCFLGNSDLVSSLERCCSACVAEKTKNELARISHDYSSTIAMPKAVYYIEQFSSGEDAFQSSGHFVKHLLDNYLIPVLYEYSKNSSVKETDMEAVPVLSFLIGMAQIEKSLPSYDLLVHYSLGNLKLICSTEDTSVDEFFPSNEALAGLMTLTFLSGGIEESLQNKEQKIVYQGLANYPYLQSSLFAQKMEKEAALEVTTCHLLKDHCMFDCRRKYIWKTGSRACRDILHFSHVDIMKTHGHHSELNFLYYLNRGRPSYAYVKCIGQEIIHKKMIHSKRVNVSCSKAAGLGLQNFFDGTISSAAVAFIEMLSKNSFWLRIHLASLQAVRFNSKQANLDLSSSLSSGINRNNKEMFFRLKKELEHSMSKKLPDERPSVLPILKWKIPLTFSFVNKLELNCTFLDECAESSDWIMFTIFSQYYQFSKEQILNALVKFKNPVVREHLKNAFLHLYYQFPRNYHVSRKRESFISSYDSRHKLYEKIGLSKISSSSQEFVENEMTETSTTGNVDSSESEFVGAELIETINKENMDSLSDSTESDFIMFNSVLQDFFGVLLKSEKITLQSRFLLMNAVQFENPVLALTASCYMRTERILLECLCVWLTISVDHTSRFKTFSAVEPALSTHTWMLDDLVAIIKATIHMERFSLLVQGFYLFQHTSPLFHLLKFIRNFFEESDDAISSVGLWHAFIESINKFQENDCVHNDIIGDLNWIEKCCVEIILESVKICSQSKKALEFLQLILRENGQQIFKSLVEIPWFPILTPLHECIRDEDIAFPYKKLFEDCSALEFLTNCNDLLKELISKGKYELANSFAELANLDRDIIVLLQLEEEFCKIKNSSQWYHANTRLNFWMKCLHDLQNINVQSYKITKFFKDLADQAFSYSEKFFLLKICLMCWNEPVNRSRVETEIIMWQYRINAEMDLEFTDREKQCFIEFAFNLTSPIQPVKPKDSILLEGQLHVPTVPCSLNNTEEEVILQRIIQNELDAGNIVQAYRLTKLFDVEEKNLNVLLVCMDLAEGKMAFKDVEIQLKLVLGEVSTDYCTLISLLPRKDSISASSQSCQAKFKDGDVLRVLQKLSTCSRPGMRSCLLVILYHWISMILDLHYTYIIHHHLNDFDILKILMESKVSQRHIIVKEFIKIMKIPEDKVARLLVEEFLSAYKMFTETNKGDNVNVHFMWSKKYLESCAPLVSICTNKSVFGHQLLEAVDSLQSPDKGTKKAFSSLEIELCIIAHECFSIACNTEGIANVLQKAKGLIKFLIATEEFSLIIHLLCGLGRFSEMLYVFDVLLDHDQFELLLKKGVQKSTKLKQALVNYVTYHHPLNRELFTMIAFHFRLCRNIGEMHEDIARQKLKQIGGQELNNSKTSVENLECILQYFVDAAEYFFKSNCESHAVRCSNWAQLVALQIFLLPKNKTILNMTDKEVEMFIVNHHCFLEAYVVAQTYMEHRHWCNALYVNFIVRGSKDYLEKFHEHVGITDSTIEGIISRIQKESEHLHARLDQTKKLIRMSKDTVFIFKMVKRLGVKDAEMEELVGSPVIKDLGLS